ncbi:helix-turn-helix domain-containing protein [Porcincola intestinalis]|uniref:helix-turn-helix domain-containing protein n=1 Tax=Porcincola intestinalis TaxID=2606632 RepID=UPI002A91B3C4|nr:helix-turn-helix domain-containing protein [Porcincola intestinalis]MDY5579563.1 helix-turn-helix domain-containing protein [Porcincola intestinalis]
MLKDNLVMLRNLHGFSQEAIAEKIGISRQAYAKWETGATVPDIEKSLSLAEVYGTTIDSLIRTESVEGLGIIPPAPRGKNIWGSVAVGERGQIVIPKGARDLFGLTGGQRMVVLSDENGIALISEEVFMSNMRNAMERSLEKQD